MPELGPLTKEIFGDTSANGELGPLTKEILGSSNNTPDQVIPPPQSETTALANKFTAGVGRGVLDVSDNLDLARGTIHDTLFGRDPNSEYDLEKTQSKRKEREKLYNQTYGDEPVSGIGRTSGQILATSPFVPGATIKGALNALPTTALTGETVTAPILNRFAGSVATGAVGGAGFGALTSKDNLAEDVTKGIVGGAIGNPLVEGAGVAGSNVLPTVRSMWANTDIKKIAETANLPSSAVKNIVDRLADAGLTPQQAQTALTKMGPSATLADLDASLTTEASGLASLGGKPTSILKTRFNDRAETGNSNALQIMESKLGRKPDFDLEKQKIIDQATALTANDYNVAKNSGHVLDASSIVKSIDDSMVNAVGKEASQLKEAKSYLFRTVKDAQGNDVQVLKNDVASLHKVRQALDDTLERLPKEGTSQQSATYRAINDVRAQVDAKLKSVPEMAAADAKFAEKMKIAKGLQIGQDFLNKKVNRETFDRVYDNSPLEVQQTTRKGMRIAIGDYMDRASRGELESSQQLFGKKSINRYMLEKVFGSRGSETLDALSEEASKKFTERAITVGSQTAERLAVQRRYNEFPSTTGMLSEAVKGGAVDLASGSSGLAALTMAGRRYLSNKNIQFSTNRLGQLAEGSADLLSRQGSDRDVGMSVLRRTKLIQDKLDTQSALEKLTTKFPTKSVFGTAGVSLGNTLYDKVKDRF